MKLIELVINCLNFRQNYKTKKFNDTLQFFSCLDKIIIILSFHLTRGIIDSSRKSYIIF